MRVLVTAGSTQVPIDKVRCISNIFKGKTGASIAKYFAEQNCQVTLLTSADPTDPKLASILGCNGRLNFYQTFDDLAVALENEITNNEYDVIIHSAAVSDYKIGRVLTNIQDPEVVNSEKKISSSHQKLYLELTPTIKLIDQIRKPWGFKGKLVKFKLQVGISDAELLSIARESRKASDADLIVANCLEWAKQRAYIIGSDDREVSVTREALPYELFKRLS